MARIDYFLGDLNIRNLLLTSACNEVFAGCLLKLIDESDPMTGKDCLVISIEPKTRIPLNKLETKRQELRQLLRSKFSVSITSRLIVDIRPRS